MSSPLLLDVNVWVALNFDKHVHHVAAKQWYVAVPASAALVFCRQTQLGLFRILTTAAVMGPEVLTQLECWQIYDRWISTGQIAWADEPRDLEVRLRALTSHAAASPKEWMDAYLAAFVEAGNLTLVTMDHALAAKVKGAVLLG
ncbi:MAG: TA system VapC family ribonuclease toxin [Terracidiphilus sp.]|jgi:toxin-antitoxin system PIN domain toxin